MRRLASHHAFPGEFLPATVTAQVPCRPILDDPIDETLDQPARATLAVSVEQRAAARAVDSDGAPFQRGVYPVEVANWGF